MQSATLMVIASVLNLASYSTGAAVQLSCDSQLRLVLPALFTHCSCSYSEWSAWEAVPNSVVRVRTSQCRSNESYNETRTQSAIGQGCQSRTQTRSVCKYGLHLGLLADYLYMFLFYCFLYSASERRVEIIWHFLYTRYARP